MLKNAPTLAIVAVHTEENEPSRILIWNTTNIYIHYLEPSKLLLQRGLDLGEAQPRVLQLRALRAQRLGITGATPVRDPHFIESVEGSFSSVSTPLIARVGAFFRIFRALQDLHSFAPLESQVENCLEKNFPENPKEKNETTRPHGKGENCETIWDAGNST